MEEIVNLARFHTGEDLALEEAINKYDECVEEEAKRHQEALKAKGVPCHECGRIFIPLPDDFGCCSIGCRFA